MRNPQAFDGLTNIRQDRFTETKNAIEKARSVEELVVALEQTVAGQAFQVEDVPNLRLWIPVLNKLDEALASILGQHGDVLLLPKRDREEVLRGWRRNREIVDTAAAEAAAAVACSQLKVILRWTTSLFRNSIQRENYLSFEHVHRCLWAYDDELASLALSLFATWCIQQNNHRFVMIHHLYSLYSSENDQHKFADFYDIVSAAQSPCIRRPADILASASSSSAASSSSSSSRASQTLDLTLPPRKYYASSPFDGSGSRRKTRAGAEIQRDEQQELQRIINQLFIDIG